MSSSALPPQEPPVTVRAAELQGRYRALREVGGFVSRSVEPLQEAFARYRAQPDASAEAQLDAMLDIVALSVRLADDISRWLETEAETAQAEIELLRRASAARPPGPRRP